jgi:hypothetical protein
MRGEDDFASEIASHIALKTERLIAEGHSAEAARAALRKFGNVTRARERYHESGP